MNTRKIKFFGLLAAAGLAALLLVAPGCKNTSLAPGGPYSYSTTNVVGSNTVVTTVSDLQLYQADVSFETAYKAAFTICNIEFQNRDYFWKISPSIKHSIDKIRPLVWESQGEYTTARAAYIAHPTPAGLTGVDAVVAKIQQLLIAATAALGTTNTPSITSTNQ